MDNFRFLEKLIYKTQLIENNEVKPIITKSCLNTFFVSYRNRYTMYIIYNFLVSKEQIEFQFLNKFTMKNIKASQEKEVAVI